MAHRHDSKVLRHTLERILGLPKPVQNTMVWRALEDAGITGWVTDFIGLPEDDFYRLRVPPRVDNAGNILEPERPLPLSVTRQLVLLAAFYHDKAREAGMTNLTDKYFDPRNLSRIEFDEYRILKARSKNTIIPFHQPLSNTSGNMDLLYWRKNMRPSKADFKEF